MWALWWVWAAGALMLAVIEVIVPGYIFLGFAIGAAITGAVLLVGGPLSAWLSGSLAVLLVFFAVLSLVAWWLLRRFVGVRSGQITYFDRDINED